MLNKIQQKHLKVICIFFLTFTLVFSMFKTVYADNVDVLNAPETVSVQTLENELKTATNETNTDIVKAQDFFWDGDKYVLGNAVVSGSGNDQNSSDSYSTADYVSYENWKKE